MPILALCFLAITWRRLCEAKCETNNANGYTGVITAMRKVLPQRQKNEIMQVMTNRGLDTSAFQWQESPSSIDPDVTISRLVHSATAYYFSFDFLNDLHFNERRPGNDSPVDTRYPGSWEHQFKYFFEWLNVFGDSG
jgi:hypothetical protein